MSLLAPRLYPPAAARSVLTTRCLRFSLVSASQEKKAQAETEAKNKRLQQQLFQLEMVLQQQREEIAKNARTLKEQGRLLPLHGA